MKIRRAPSSVFTALVFAAGIIALLASCKHEGKQGAGGQDKLRVVTTLFPLYDMAKNIGGARAEVTLLLPPGVEAHSFEPKPGDVLKINEADIFVYTGKFMEPWAEGIIKGAANKDLLVVDASRGTKMIASVFHDEDEPAGAPDPHIWLDFDNAKIMLRNITHAFQAKDGGHRDFYARNAQEYERKLTELDAAYRSALSTCRKKEIIYAGHYAFGYMARRYGLEYIAAQGVSPDAEPTARDLVKLVRQIRKDNIRYVFYEELTSPKIAETLATETGARMLLLNAAHNLTREQFEKGVSYFDILRGDLENLKTGLECR
jgi:zinc transport system substrate-binding protein